MTFRSLIRRLAVLSLATILTVGVVAAAQAEQKRKHGKQKKRMAHSAQVTEKYRGRHLFPAGPVYHGSDYLGDDPDPFIRLQLQRDHFRFGGPD